MGCTEKKYTQWKTLNLRATGLGRDSSTGCIVADDDWWKEQEHVRHTLRAIHCYRKIGIVEQIV